MFNGSNPYVPPKFNNQFFAALGDSITHNGGGALYQSGSLSISTQAGNGYSGWLFALSGGKFVPEQSWNFGRGAQTTAGGAGRINRSGNDCNDASQGAFTVYCFTGAVATISASGNNSGQATITTTGTPTSVTGVSPTVNTQYVEVGTANAAPMQSVLSTINSSTSYTLSQNLVSSGNNLTVVFSPFDSTSSSHSSDFASHLGASGVGSLTTDIENNFANTGVYSVSTDPAQVVAIHMGTNDANMTNTTTQPQSLVNLAYMLDKLGPNGANKIVVLTDQIPRGLATGYSAAKASGAQINPGNINAAFTIASPEIHTMPASSSTCGATTGYCITVDNASYFYPEPSGSTLPKVFFTPCGTTTTGTPSGHNGSVTTDYYGCGTTASGSNFTAGANDGVVLVQDSSANCNQSTPAVTAPSGATHYFCMSSAGVMTVNSADANAVVGIYYRYLLNNSGGSNYPSYMSLIHDWAASSSCGSFFSVSYQTSYPISGAQCNRPWVHVAPTWAATIDPGAGNCVSVASGGTGLCYPAPYILTDGLHPQPAGGALMANAVLNTATSAGAVQSTTPFPLETQSNVYVVAAASGAPGTITTLCPQSPQMAAASAAANSKSWYISGLSPAVSTQAYGAVGAGSYAVVTNGPTFYPVTYSSTGFTVAPTVTCLDSQNNLLQVSSPATSTWSIGASQVALSKTSFLANGVFVNANGQFNTSPTVTGCGASNVNCGTANYGGWSITQGAPTNWTLSLDAATQAAITSGNIKFSFGLASNPFGDGYNYEVLQMQGYLPSGNGAVSLSETIGSSADYGPAFTIKSGDLHRAQCDVRIGAGPNGRLYGLLNTIISVADHTTTNFNPPGIPSANATWYNTTNLVTGQAGGGGMEFNDAVIATGAPGVTNNLLKVSAISPPAQMGTVTSASTVGYINFGTTINYTGGDFQSWTVVIGRCGAGKVSS